MTFGEMLTYTSRFKEILNGPRELKVSRLKSLSDDLLAFSDASNDEFAKQMFCSILEEMYM